MSPPLRTGESLEVPENDRRKFLTSLRDIMQPCPAHSGIEAEIENLKSSDSEQWERINKMSEKISLVDSKITTRLNVILATIIVGIVVALVEIAFKR